MLHEGRPSYKKPPVPEFIGPVFVKTSPKRSFSRIEHGRYGLVFAKTGFTNSDTDIKKRTSSTRVIFSLWKCRNHNIFTSLNSLHILLKGQCYEIDILFKVFL
jgi:hypothetical protein